MDSFTERILERARERQRKLEEYNQDGNPELRQGAKSAFENAHKIMSSCSQPNLTERKVIRKEVVSDSSLNSKFAAALKENNSEGNLNRQNSKTRVSSESCCSPKSNLKTFNIKKDNFNMEIKLTSTENVRVEVEIEERDEDDSSGNEKPAMRDDAKKRLQRLGKLYSGGEDAIISSPIHRSEIKLFEKEQVAEKCHESRIIQKETPSEDSESSEEKENEMYSRKGLGGLAALAKNIDEWEDDTKVRKEEEKPVIRRTWKPRAPAPPTPASSDSIKLETKIPKVISPIKTPSKKTDVTVSPTKTPARGTEIAKGTPKQLKWDQAVLETLESQGFTRTESNTRLTYDYDKQSEPEKKISTLNVEIKNDRIIEETSTSKVESPKKFLPSSPSKVIVSPNKVINSPRGIRAGAIADKAAIFEGSPSRNAKDPALMSVLERKALFEKNKGSIPVPKAPISMATPIKKETPAKKPMVSKVVEEKSIAPSKLSTPEGGGIAKKMAALLENKITISQQQITHGVREQRQQEMDILLNRFQKNKQVLAPPKAGPIQDSDSEDEHDATETTVMISQKPSKIVKPTIVPPPPPPPGSSGQKRKSGENLNNSPKVTAVLDDVKRIKVSPPKPGRLYPCLSDIETVTEPEPESPNTSLEDSYGESDGANTSFGRDILEAVCKNQTPQKRVIYDDSTASDISDVLDEMDDYLDEAIAHAEAGPTPPKQSREHSPGKVLPSNSFLYKSFSSHNTPNKSPKKLPPPELPTHIIDGDNLLPLTHTVSFYRRQQTPGPKTPVKQVTRHPIIEESSDNCSISSESVEVELKIQELMDEVSKQQTIISQTSQALNLCYSTPEFIGSTEQVEAEKVLLLASHRRQAALHEIQRLKVEGTLRPQAQHSQNLLLEKGTLTISRLSLPLKREYVRALAAAGGKGHHVVCLIKCGEQVFPTQLVSTVAPSSKNLDLELNIPGTVQLKNIYSDFMVTLEVYCLQAQEEILPHEVKYHINSKKSSSKLTPRKNKQESRMIIPPKESPAGPQSVRSPVFALMGYVVFSIQAVNRKHWALNNTPSMSPLEGSVDMRVVCELAVTIEQRGFLTMFEDVSGFGAWHRRWCLLKGNTLSYWKYPDDEKKKTPIDSISLRDCITQQAGPVSRDICARLHTLLIETQRDAQPQDKDSLIMLCKGSKTIIRHLLSADTKEERIEWCSALNKALMAMKMWGNCST